MNDTSSTANIQALELKLLTKEGRMDYDFINSTLAEDFMECGANGRVFDKANVLSRLPQEDDSFLFEAGEMNTALVSDSVAINSFNVDITKHNVTLTSFRHSVWVYRNNQWTMRYHQGTNLSE